MENKLKRELEELRAAFFKTEEKTQCTPEEFHMYRRLQEKGQPLPEGIIEAPIGQNPEYTTFYKVKKATLTLEERNELLTLKKLKFLKTIRNCVVFFTVLAILDLIIGIF